MWECSAEGVDTNRRHGEVTPTAGNVNDLEGSDVELNKAGIDG